MKRNIKPRYKEIVRKVKFDIFPYRLIIVVSNDVIESRAKRDYMFGPSRLVNAAAIHTSDGGGESYIFIRHDAVPGIVAHEANHCAWALMETIGAKHEEEVMAYVLYYVVQAVIKAMSQY